MSAHAATKAQPSPAVTQTRAGELLQRKCGCGTHTIAGGACEGCSKKKEGVLRRSVAGAGHVGVGGVPPAVGEVLGSPGRPLDAGTRSFMETRFQHDFSRVRVHTDARADESARSVGARAYTVGQDVVFAAGLYQPATAEGQRLLAHELTHVVQQQNRPTPQGHLAIGEVNDPAEREADAVAAAVSGNQRPPIVSRLPTAALRRQPKPTAPTPASPGSPSCTPRIGPTEYGCYCGAGTSCGSGLSCTPANPLDACCQRHDRDYGSCSFSDRYNPFGSCFTVTRAADGRLCNCARGLAGRVSGASEAYRQGVMALFCP
ncbi:MAG: DUF4157 domain-containing protein [Acidobacteriota bacterium]|nr:DUF4157 domain-containing protein [Acidobacteriota bacterium]